MIICRVVGHIWATKKEPNLEGLKLMLVKEEDTEGPEHTYVAADIVGAGVGEQVLVVSGSTARKAFGNDNIPADMAIVAIIDTVEVEREKARKKVQA
ncbi:MAG: EutN/CcmL family microcompartment protein [Lachnospiraceae bacterium]|nr:EutN/CcmL family microcompartment protein [Lachnospiraceae bacterium]